MGQIRCALFILLCSFCISVCGQSNSGSDPSTQYRFSFFPYYRIKGDLSGFNEFTYANDPTTQVERYYFGFPQVGYGVNKWLELGGGLRTIYTFNESKSDTLEMRPWIGARLNIQDPWKWHIYNYVRLEYRDTLTLDTSRWSDTFRLRSRLGVEVPLTQRACAWKSKTWYGLADVEALYTFVDPTITPVRVRTGVGYIVSNRLHLELLYGAQFSRVNNDGLQYSANQIRLNVRFAFADGLL